MTTETLTKKVGQRVTLTHSRFLGQTGVITKVNPKNVIVTLDTGGRVNANPVFLVNEGQQVQAQVEFIPYRDPFADLPTQNVGALVRVKGKPGLFVVLADKVEKINVAKLGGEARSRYWRVPRQNIEPTTPAQEGIR